MRISDWSSDVCSSDLLPLKSRRVPEDNVPAWLWRSAPDHEAMADIAEDERFIGETSAKQVFHRMAGTWTYWGWKGGYFDAEEDARAYYDEMRYMLARQMGAPNSPQCFNPAPHCAYRLRAPPTGPP